MAIIGILAAIAVPNMLNAQMKARISRVHADQKAVSDALEMYYIDWNTYVEDHDYPSDTSQRGLFRLTSPMAYMSSLPRDPFIPSYKEGNEEDNPTFEFGSGHATQSQQWPAQAYIIISPGPDLEEQVSGNDGFPRNVKIYRYSITNGIMSSGDIVRMGGNYNSGVIVMDGKYFVGSS